MKLGKNVVVWLIAFVALSTVMSFFENRNFASNHENLAFSDFMNEVKSKHIASVTMSGAEIYSMTNDGKKYVTYAPYSPSTVDTLLENNVKVEAKPQDTSGDTLWSIIISWFPMILLVGVWIFFMRQASAGNNKAMSFGKSRARLIENTKKVTFKDVAGADESKQELEEIVDFLKDPQKFQRLGGKIPKGVLLVGPPGTGKTLLARAVAGEAGVSFFKISGSDFVEMFVGVGASRVRDLFRQAREKAPCIVFIDELDAIGKSRVNSLNSNDEREQTLNQLLVEMDGFDNSKGLIVLAATNRPDVLDPALLRPGRFDRQVSVDRPDVKGREAILKIHAKNVKLGPDVDLAAIARTTSGFAGADLANVINEAALLAVRSKRKVVLNEDLQEAVEKAIAGLQKKSRVIKEKERIIVAFHETGHALAAAFTEGADKVHKISIIPRGVAALGYTLQMPEEDRYLRTEKELYGEIDVLLGGRAAEFVAFGEVSTGASNDLQRATDIARRILTDFGMSEKYRNVVLSQRGSGYGADAPQLVREYSEATQQYIDEELARIMNQRFERVVSLLTEKKDVLDYIAHRLLEKEIIEQAEFEDIVNARVHLDELAVNSGEPEKKAETPALSDVIQLGEPEHTSEAIDDVQNKD